MDWMTNPEAWIAFATLLALEIVLGIDNVVFISILAGKLPANQQAKARYLGLALAMVTRIILLFSISWMVRLTAPLVHCFGHGNFGPGLDTDRRRAVSDWQKYPRNPSKTRR
jgi:Membrane protein TerC, possibly involved in tellurium resistance